MFTKQRNSIGSKDHFRAALWTHETVGSCPRRIGWDGRQGIRIDDLSGVQFPVKDGQFAAGAGVTHVKGETIFEGGTFFDWIVRNFAQPVPGFREHSMLAAGIDRAFQVTARCAPLPRFGLDDPIVQQALCVVSRHGLILQRKIHIFDKHLFPHPNPLPGGEGKS